MSSSPCSGTASPSRRATTSSSGRSTPCCQGASVTRRPSLAASARRNEGVKSCLVIAWPFIRRYGRSRGPPSIAWKNSDGSTPRASARAMVSAPASRVLLSDPAKGFPLGAGQELFGGLEFTEPDDVKELADGMTLSLVGLEINVNHAPGHTEGSVTFRLPLEHPPAQSPITAQGESKMGGAGPDGVDVLFSGDLLFAGSIGRTDLPGGDYPTILRSLAQVCLTLPD